MSEYSYIDVRLRAGDAPAIVWPDAAGRGIWLAPMTGGLMTLYPVENVAAVWSELSAAYDDSRMDAIKTAVLNIAKAAPLIMTLPR